MEPANADSYPQPEWNDPDSLGHALEALHNADDASSAQEAHDRFLWAVGDNHSGSYYPVVLAALPGLEQVLLTGNAWAQQTVLESLIDLGGPFVPEEGHETHLGHPVKHTLHAFLQTLRPHVAALAQGQHERARSARELLELIDDLPAHALRH